MGDTENAANDAIPSEAPPSNVVDLEHARNERDFKPLPDDLGGEDTVTPRIPDAAREYLKQRNPDRLDRIDAMSDEEVVKQASYQGMKLNDVLTPAERQDMDASADKPIVDNTEYERFTPNPEERVAANDEAVVPPFAEVKARQDGGGGQEPPEEPPQKPMDPGYEGLDPEEKLLKALKAAKPVSREQVRAFHEARKANAGKLIQIQDRGQGLKDYQASLGALKGSLPKVDYESMAHNFTPEDFDTLVNRINKNNWLQPHEKVATTTGLMKILGAEGAKIPTPSEIKLLTHVFGEDLVKELLRHRGGMEKFWNHVANGLNVPRSLMASFDLSAPFRQGVFLIHTKAFWKSFAHMFKLFGSEKASQALMEEIKSRDTYPLMRRAGLALTDPEGHYLTQREEAFMSSWAEKIPAVGRIVRASDRAYSGFLNKLRADTFDSLVKLQKEVGVSLEDNGKALKDTGSFINAATGRGDLKFFGKNLNEAGPFLNSVFFSPRLIASRLQLLNPAYYATLSPVVRVQAIKSLMAFGAIATTVLGLAAAAGAEVETNPTSSDFGKIKTGDTRYDILGGFQQYIRLGAEMWTGKTTSATGNERDLTEGKFGEDTRWTLFEKFIRNKFSPVASFVADAMDGKDAVGQPFKPTKAVMSRFIPLVAQDAADAYNEYGAQGLSSAVPGIFGIGVQTYSPKPSSQKENDAFMKPFNPSASQDEWWKEYEK
jgi:hypothetical protein